LLIGHGTRSERGTEQFLALAASMAGDVAPAPVETAFLELRQPDIETAVGRLIARGIRRLITIPLLLFAAGHAKEDVPEAVAAALARHNRSDIQHRQAQHLGCHPAIVELSALRLAEARSVNEFSRGQPENRATKRQCILVGRGSGDASATAEMFELVRQSSALTPDRDYHVAFAAVAQPRLPDVLALVASRNAAEVAVQPHLLFDGEVFDLVARETAAAAARWPATRWLLAPVLADEPGNAARGMELLAAAVLDRCAEAPSADLAAPGSRPAHSSNDVMM
jgi:sirohydrochlorin cobaltochelatase